MFICCAIVSTKQEHHPIYSLVLHLSLSFSKHETFSSHPRWRDWSRIRSLYVSLVSKQHHERHTNPLIDTFTNLIVDGIKSGYYQYVRINNNHWSHQSVQDVNSTDMRCGGEMIFPTNASTKAVSAGTTVGFSVEGGLGHPGPLQFYMAQAPAGQNLSSWNGTGEVWFKIAGDSPSVNSSGLTWPHQRELYLLRYL